MKIGMQLHPDRGTDNVLEEAQLADEHGFDSVWLSDHLFSPGGNHSNPDLPLDTLVLATAIGATTKRTRLAWATLNLTLRPPALMAKSLTSLDQVTHGRVIAALGSGWNKPEWEAYNLPIVEDHDDRAAYAREVVELFKELWTHPAPALTSYAGEYVHVDELPFNPAPVQKPHPPIWFGGESDATMQTVKELCDGWMPLRAAGNPEVLKGIITADDWPDRPMDIVKGGRLCVDPDHDVALEMAKVEHEWMLEFAPQQAADSLEAFVAREIVGTPDECMTRIREIDSWGVNYLRINFLKPTSQEAAAEHILPRLAELDT